MRKILSKIGYGEKSPKLLSPEDLLEKLPTEIAEEIQRLSSAKQISGLYAGDGALIRNCVSRLQTWIERTGYTVVGGAEAFVNLQIFGDVTPVERDLSEWSAIEDTLKAQSETVVAPEVVMPTVVEQLSKIRQDGQDATDDRIIKSVNTQLANQAADEEMIKRVLSQ